RAERGAHVSHDRRRGAMPRDDDRVALAMGVLDGGYGDHLLLSSDTRRDFGKVARFVTQLRAAGVTAAMLHTVLFDNPRRFLAFVPRSLSFRDLQARVSELTAESAEHTESRTSLGGLGAPGARPSIL